MSVDKVNILIVEDELITALDLSNGLQRDGYFINGIADNSKDAIRLFERTRPDIIVMDINIRGEKDGIATTHELLKIKKVPVIYITAYTDDETVNRVKEIQPAAFLTKPFNISNVRIAIELAIANLSAAASNPNTRAASANENRYETPDKEPILQMGDFIFIKSNYCFVKVRFSELLYIQAENNYVCVVTREKKFLLRLSLNACLEHIEYSKLVRVHRSYAINIDGITSFNEQSVYMDKIEIPIGKNYKSGFLENFRF